MTIHPRIVFYSAVLLTIGIATVIVRHPIPELPAPYSRNVYPQ